MHHVVVRAPLSPFGALVLPPQEANRLRMVRCPREVLAEFGVQLP